MKNWKEEFDKEFKIFELVSEDEVEGTFCIEEDREKVKKFIERLLAIRD